MAYVYDSNGNILLGEGQSVNPAYISPQGRVQAEAYAANKSGQQVSVPVDQIKAVNTAGTLGAYAPSIPQATAPTNATQINSMPNFSMPSTTPTMPNMSNVSGLTSFYSTLFDTYSQQQQDYAKQIEAQRAIQTKQTSPYLDALNKSKSPSQVSAEAFQQTGINPQEYFAEEKAKLAEIETLNKEYNAVVAAKDQQIAQSYDKLASNNFINNQIGQIERNAAPKLNQMAANINSKAATLEAMQGRFREAQAYVNEAVQNATADLKFNFDMYQTFYNDNQDKIDRLDAKYQNAFAGAVSAAEKAYTTAYDEKTQVGKLMLSYPAAGITINDSLDQAYIKLGNNPEAIKAGTETVNSSSTNRFTSSQLNKGANNSGMSLESFKALPGDVQNFYVNLSSTQASELNGMLSDVKSGVLSKEEALEAINGIAFNQSVKDYLISQINSVPSKSGTSSGNSLFGNPFAGSGAAIPNFFNNVWDQIKYMTTGK